MKKAILLFTVFFILGLLNNAITAQNNYYKSLHDDINLTRVFDVIKTNDNGLAFTNNQGEILKVDSTAQIIFYKRIIDSIIRFERIIQTTDSGFIICAPYSIIIVSKFDKNGNYMWSKKYNSPSTYVGSILSSDDNGFYMLSEDCASPTLLTKCNEIGEIQWQKKSSYDAFSKKIIRVSTNKLLAIGLKTDPTHSSQIISLHEIDTAGNYLWLKTLVNYSPYGDIQIDALITDNEEISIMIYSKLSNLSNSQIVTIHLDTLGNFLWSQKIYTTQPINYFRINSFTETYDKGYLYTGMLVLNSTDTRVICIKTDSLNNLEWTRYFGNMNFNNIGCNDGRKVLVIGENPYIFCTNGDGVAIAKLDQYGYGFCNFEGMDFKTDTIVYNVTNIPVTTLNSVFNSENFSLIFDTVNAYTQIHCTNYTEDITIYDGMDNGTKYYPNPATDQVTVVGKDIQELQLIDVQGRVFQYLENISNDQISLNISQIPEGIYFIRVTSAAGIMVRKMVKI